MLKNKKAFTLAEVLITLAIIGVVAAISIPSVISNSQQQEFKTGLRKAVSVLNSAITMNMALDGESPYDNTNLFGFFMKHMAVTETGDNIKTKFFITAAYTGNPTGSEWVFNNAFFYTTDGMRYEFSRETSSTYSYNRNKLHENSDIYVCAQNMVTATGTYSCGGCGSYGLNSNSDNTTKPPCMIMVDVNGDKKPSPTNVNCMDLECGHNNYYKFGDANGTKLTDLFSIMITDKSAIPYGVAAQRAMYQAQGKNK